MEQFEATSAIWLGDFMCEKGDKLTLKDGFKLYSSSGKWINLNYVSNHVKEVN